MGCPLSKLANEISSAPTIQSKTNRSITQFILKFGLKFPMKKKTWAEVYKEATKTTHQRFAAFYGTTAANFLELSATDRSPIQSLVEASFCLI